MMRGPREHGVWLLVGALAILLGVLAVLQYHWTGEIGRAEADRQRTRLERASQRFARELGRELGQVIGAFRPEMPGRGPAEPRESLLRRLGRWDASEHGALVSSLTLLTPSDSGAAVAELADAERLEFERIPFPARLEPLWRRLEDGLEARNPRRGGFRPDAFLAEPPAVVVPVIAVDSGGPSGFGTRSLRLAGIAVAELDEGYLGEVLLPELAEIHFGPLDEGDYAVAVLRQRDDSVLYSSDAALGPDELARPDVRLELSVWPGGPESPKGRFERGRRFGARLPMMGDRRPERRPADRPPPRDTGEPDAAPERRAGGGPPGDGLMRLPPGGVRSPWVLVVRHHGGSLAEAVDAVRRRNLAVGFGVLALLGTAAVLLAVGGQRARHLARQQLEFVAGVTHELHTPLAAIRSAGQNLADGVVSEPAHTRRYGELIQKEGGRLSALVAQVLDFAGIESGSRAYAAEPVPVARLVDKVVGDLGLVLEQAGMTVETDIPGDLPDVQGDADALSRALENLITNATKFARQGGWIGIRALAASDGRTVVLGIDDRGPGIPKAERTRVLEPFYRGRGARESQSPGSGLGLSLVRHVVEAHGGRIRVRGGSEGGTTVEMELPTGAKPSGEST